MHIKTLHFGYLFLRACYGGQKEHVIYLTKIVIYFPCVIVDLEVLSTCFLRLMIYDDNFVDCLRNVRQLLQTIIVRHRTSEYQVMTLK